MSADTRASTTMLEAHRKLWQPTLLHSSVDVSRMASRQGCTSLCPREPAAVKVVTPAESEAALQVVLGLATGSTPKTLYEELIRLHKEEDLSFSNVVTFNLDEYYPLQVPSMSAAHVKRAKHCETSNSIMTFGCL